MKTKPLKFLLALTFLFLFSGSSVVFGNDNNDAFDAAKKGDHKITYELWLSLAEQGHAYAQDNLDLPSGKKATTPMSNKENWFKRLWNGLSMMLVFFIFVGLYWLLGLIVKLITGMEIRTERSYLVASVIGFFILILLNNLLSS
jgi:hypothetical protein